MNHEPPKCTECDGYGNVGRLHMTGDTKCEACGGSGRPRGWEELLGRVINSCDEAMPDFIATKSVVVLASVLWKNGVRVA